MEDERLNPQITERTAGPGWTRLDPAGPGRTRLDPELHLAHYLHYFRTSRASLTVRWK